MDYLQKYSKIDQLMLLELITKQYLAFNDLITIRKCMESMLSKIQT